MKNKIFFVILILFGLFLIGCSQGDNPSGGNENGESGSELDAKFSEVSAYIKENIPYFVTEDIYLIDYYDE